MASVFSVLKSGGSIKILKSDPVLEVVGSLSLTGLVDVTVTRENIVTCSKPSWSVGDAVPLKFTRKVKSDVKLSATVPIKRVLVDLQSDYNDLVLANDDLVDEDELLASDIPADKIVSDCSTKKRACANCVCGRAELEDLEEKAKTKTLTLDKAAGCGNCSKGDAYRCGGCPYLGKPAFKAGEEKLILNLSVSDM